MAEWEKMAVEPSSEKETRRVKRLRQMAKRIVWTGQAKADLRAKEQQTACRY
jgi:hypothetical protein